MKKILALLVLFCGIFAYDVNAGSTPRSTVQLFINAAKGGDVSGVKRQIQNGSKYGNGDSEGILAMMLLFQEAYIDNVESAGWNKAIVYVSVKNPMTGERTTCPLTVRKINGNWLIGD